jgi:hypothetical protein
MGTVASHPGGVDATASAVVEGVVHGGEEQLLRGQLIVALIADEFLEPGRRVRDPQGRSILNPPTWARWICAVVPIVINPEKFRRETARDRNGECGRPVSPLQQIPLKLIGVHLW